MVVDETGSSWLTAFNDVATDLLGHSAPELKTLVERNNQAEWEQYFVRANFKSYIFKVIKEKIVVFLCAFTTAYMYAGESKNGKTSR